MDRDNSHGRRRQTSEENASDEDRKARNRRAARKCRKNKDEQMQKLKQKNHELEEENKKLSEEKKELKQQALACKKLVAMHCEKGCNIPKEMKHLWDKEMEDNSSSDEDDSERNMHGGVEISEDMPATPQYPSDMPGTLQDLHNELPCSAEQVFEAPVALFSGTPLKHLQGGRSRNNDITKSSPPAVSSAQVPVGNANLHLLTDLSRFLESTSVPNYSELISTRSTNDVRMQMDITAVPYNANNNPASMMSNTFCGMGNLPQMAPASRDITQVQDVQPRIEFGTSHQLPDNPLMDMSGQIAMEYQTEGLTEERLLSNEAVVNQNSPSNVLSVPEGYTFIEELFNTNNKNGNKESENDEMQAQDVSSNKEFRYYQSQSQREPTIHVQTLARALLNIGPEMAHSLQQQIKTISSLPCRTVETVTGTDATSIGPEMAHSLQQQIKTISSLPCRTVETVTGTDATSIGPEMAHSLQQQIKTISSLPCRTVETVTGSDATSIGPEMAHSLQQQIKTISSLPCRTVETVAGTDATSKCRHNKWPTNPRLNSRPEEQTESTSQQRKYNTDNVHTMIASRNIRSRSETERRDQHAATGMTLNVPKSNVIKEPIQATVLSQEQMFTLKQRQGERQNPQSGSFTGRKTTMSLQQHGQHEQLATWSSSTDRPNSKAGNTSGKTVTHALLDSKSQSVVDLAEQKNTSRTNTLGSQRVTNYNKTLNLNQPGLKTSSLFLQRVPQRITWRTNHIAPNTATSHSSPSISLSTSGNTSSDQIMQQSLFQQTNGSCTHGHGRLAVATTNNGDVSTPSQHLAAKNTENGFIPSLATSNNGVSINKPTGFNPTSWQFHPQITRPNNTAHEFTSNPAENGARSSTLTRLITTHEFIPKPATSNNGVPNSTATRLNTAYQPHIHGTSTTNGHNLDAAASNAIYTRTQSPYKPTQPDVPCFNISISGASTVGSQTSTNSRSPFVATVLSPKQVSTATNTHIRNEYSPNTEACYNGTDTTDQVFLTTSSETSLQPMIHFSGGNFPKSQGQVVTPEDHLLIKDMLNYPSSQSDDIDYLSESPQTIELVQLRNRADDTPEYTSNNDGIEITGDVTINTQFNNDSTLDSYFMAVFDALDSGGGIPSLTTTNTSLGDNFQGLANLNITSQLSSGQTLNFDPNLPNLSDIINHNDRV